MKKQFLFNPDDPKKSFDVYIDKNEKDTIGPMKHTTLKDVENYINLLEKIYKKGEKPHTRISKNAMILRVRLRIINEKTGKAKDHESKKIMITLYNTIYNTNYSTGTSCGSCLSTCFDGIKNLYKKYSQ